MTDGNVTKLTALTAIGGLAFVAVIVYLIQKKKKERFSSDDTILDKMVARWQKEGFTVSEIEELSNVYRNKHKNFESNTPSDFMKPGEGKWCDRCHSKPANNPIETTDGWGTLHHCDKCKAEIIKNWESELAYAKMTGNERLRLRLARSKPKYKDAGEAKSDFNAGEAEAVKLAVEVAKVLIPIIKEVGGKAMDKWDSMTVEEREAWLEKISKSKVYLVAYPIPVMALKKESVRKAVAKMRTKEIRDVADKSGATAYVDKEIEKGLAYGAPKVTEADMGHNYNLDNHPAVRAWTTESYKSRAGFDRHMSLLKDNREVLKKIFGNRHGTFKSEFTFSIWKVDFRGRSYHILSADGKGTCYELVLKKSETFNSVGKDKKLGDDMVAFLEDMISRYKKVKESE